MSWLERVRNSQLFVASVAAGLTAALFLARYPPPLDAPGLVLLRMKAYPAYVFFRASYLLFAFTTPLILYSSGLAFFFVHVYRPGADTEKGALPPYTPPLEREKLYVVLGELHHPTERRRAESPRWLVMPEKGLYTGIACFGAIGSGKTASFIRPLALQLFSYAAHDPKRRLGGSCSR